MRESENDDRPKWREKRLGSSTDPRVLPVSRVLRDPPILQPSLITPIVRLLRLPRPLNPASSLLKRDGLGFPIPPEERLVSRVEIRSGPSLGRTSSDIRGTVMRSIVTCAASASVEILGAIGGSGRPFAHDRPEVEGRECASMRAGETDALVVGEGNLIVGEHLVDVHIHRYTRPHLISAGHEVTPVVETFERVVKQDDSVTLQ